MKKLTALFISMALVLSTLAGCTVKSQPKPTDAVAPKSTLSASEADENTSKDKPESSFLGSMSSFSANTMSGDTITQDIFADYDLTMVNLWMTWCGYCIDEMPGLQELYEALPENVNMISVCCDAVDEKELAQEIIDELDLSFTVLEANDELDVSLVQYVSGFPTTIFVDSKGNPVGAAQVGVATGSGSIADSYLALINGRLEALGK